MDWKKRLEINVPYEDLVAKIKAAYNKYKKAIQLEGFRKGKVPLDLIKKVYGTKIEREAAEESMSEYLEQAIDDHQIKFHDLLKVDSVDFNKKDGLSFKATIHVEPDIELTHYKKLQTEKEVYQVTDEDVTKAIENLREQHATMSDVEGEAQPGHYLVADLQETDATGHPLIGNKYENRYFQLQSGNIDDNNITNQLLGIKTGESRQVSITETQNDKSSIKYYTVTVKEIKQKSLPDIDDEFAKDVGDFENLQTLKDQIFQKLNDNAQMNYEQKLNNNLISEVIKNNPFELPDFLIESYLNAFIKNLKSHNQQQNVDELEIRQKYRADAIWNLKWRLIRNKIAELENISVDEKDVDEFIEHLAANAGEDSAKIRRDYRDQQQRDRLRLELLEQKVIDFLKEHSKIKEIKVTYQDMQKQSEMVEQ